MGETDFCSATLKGRRVKVVDLMVFASSNEFESATQTCR
jgi:hypothetical protein